MSPVILFSFVIGYFVLLLTVAWYTSRNSNNDSFFIGNRNSNWMLVAFGMIGTSLSGVTFVSVPGAVGKPMAGGVEAFAYFQIVIGYLLGYLVIAFVLLPLYYRLHLTSIYNYLQKRLGFVSYKTGASFFILSRTLGATARLYLVVKILQDSIFANLGTHFHIPFWLTTFIILVMILLYTFEGGVKTIVYTDTLQTTCMLAGLIVCVVYILHSLDLNLGSALHAMSEKHYSNLFITDPNNKLFILKQIIAGAFITITMTGLDQEMMQKNISVKKLKDSQKNVITLSLVLTLVIGLFLILGGALYLYSDSLGGHFQSVVENGKPVTKYFIAEKDALSGVIKDVAVGGDGMFPYLAVHHMPSYISIIFVIALISALFPSADGAITALTSSFCIDILGMQRNQSIGEKDKMRTRRIVHISFAATFLLFVMMFYWINNPSMIGVILKVAGYTYGPLLGLFAFGILTKRNVSDKLVPVVCILAPVICFFLDKYQAKIFAKFQIGLELLVINGLLVFIGLLMISKKPNGISIANQPV
jgi:Na+/proline symporter